MTETALLVMGLSENAHSIYLGLSDTNTNNRRHLAALEQLEEAARLLYVASVNLNPDGDQSLADPKRSPPDFTSYQLMQDGLY